MDTIKPTGMSEPTAANETQATNTSKAHETKARTNDFRNSGRLAEICLTLSPYCAIMVSTKALIFIGSWPLNILLITPKRRFAADRMYVTFMEMTRARRETIAMTKAISAQN